MSEDASKLFRLYRERSTVVALAAKMAAQAGYPAWVGRVNNPSDSSDYAVYIELPGGQVSWHIRNEDLPQFSSLPRINGRWDPHTRQDKYSAIAEFCAGVDTMISSPVPKEGA